MVNVAKGGLSERRRVAGQTRTAILAAARELIAASDATWPSLGEVAARAGVSRLTVYHHFGSKQGLFLAVASEARSTVAGAAPASDQASPVEQLRSAIAAGCERWAKDPALFRRLPTAAEADWPGSGRELVERLAAADRLRPGCSLREAEDVIGVVCSFSAFDRLHRDGRRSTVAVAEILTRMAAAVLSGPS